MKIIFHIGLYEVLIGGDDSTIYLKAKSGNQPKRCVKLPGAIQRIESRDIVMGTYFHCKDMGEWVTVSIRAIRFEGIIITKSVRYKKDETLYEHKQNH
jgi:hypothetical protein